MARTASEASRRASAGYSEPKDRFESTPKSSRNDLRMWSPCIDRSLSRPRTRVEHRAIVAVDVSTRYVDFMTTAPGLPRPVARDEAVGPSGVRVACRRATGARSFARGLAPTGLGQIEYRLARDTVVREYQRGRVSRLEVCDAQPELMRVTNNLGRVTAVDCPICEAAKLVHVAFAFGPRLP